MGVGWGSEDGANIAPTGVFYSGVEVFTHSVAACNAKD